MQQQSINIRLVPNQLKCFFLIFFAPNLQLRKAAWFMLKDNIVKPDIARSAEAWTHNCLFIYKCVIC